MSQGLIMRRQFSQGVEDYTAFKSLVDGSITQVTSDMLQGITKIGDYAFDGRRSLTSVTVENTTPPTLGNEVFGSTHSSLIIYVPAESVETYKAASGWSTYASKIQAIQ